MSDWLSPLLFAAFVFAVGAWVSHEARVEREQTLGTFGRTTSDWTRRSTQSVRFPTVPTRQAFPARRRGVRVQSDLSLHARAVQYLNEVMWW